MTRLIDADALYELIDGGYDLDFDEVPETKQALLRMIDQQETVGRWIPCTKELPKWGVSVLISHVGTVSEDYLDIDDGAMYFWNSGLDLDEEKENIAWMPLPEPWKGETDDR